MAKINTTFELSMSDLDLIETALRRKTRKLSEKRVEIIRVNAGPETEAQRISELEDDLRTVQDLLGRLHNQKNFFRPRSGVYVGG